MLEPSVIEFKKRKKIISLLVLCIFFFKLGFKLEIQFCVERARGSSKERVMVASTVVRTRCQRK